MELCNSHDIAYNDRECPLCKADAEILSLTDDIAKLEGENEELKSEIRGLSADIQAMETKIP